ncbi:MAG: translation initiation factor IF-2 [Spirochaetia bacterium]|nr:translation initiation factor IF-2 [Spirochaetales bacterium]MDX9784239.1 translation initiation factor IF-2 [Spirochaetia bacterium]
MTDNTENPQKKVHLIKQPKPLQSEAVQPRAKSEDEPQIERKKVVVVKKRLVLKKAPAKVVARHEGEPAELQQESVAPVQAQQQPEMEKPSAGPSLPERKEHTAVAHEAASITVPEPAAAEGAHKPELTKEPQGTEVQKPASETVVKKDRPKESKPAGTNSDPKKNSFQAGLERPYGAAGTVGGYPANRGRGDAPRGQPYQGRSSYQGSNYQGSNYQGSNYQGSNYQGGSYRGGYQGNSGGAGGYRSQQPYDPNRPRPQGYQGSGGYQGQRPYQGPPQGSGYQGQRPYQGPSQGGYQGSRPYTPGQGGPYPRGPRPQGPGGPGGPGAPGGYRPGYPSQGRPGGRAGNLAGGPRPGGYGARGPQNGPAPMETGRTGQRKQSPRKKGGFVRREDMELEKELQLKKKAEARAIAIPKSIDIMENISVSDLAKKMNIKPAELIAKLMGLGVMATINQKIDAETATILASEYNCEVKIVSLYDETVIEKAAENPDDLRPRAPIVTVMGHVDHGKTKLLDAIRKTDVVASEYGGITQHIGAYQVETGRGKVTFLDTPGHAAFTKMRARGSQVTDIVILVVSAVEGVMPQTKEAIDHAKAAEVPIIVAVNKIDLPESNPDRVKTQLSELALIPEEWGGTTQFCEVSALQKKGIPELLDAILLQAEILELQASYKCLAEAKIIESRIDQGRGIVATIIVDKGTLRIGDSFVAGIYPGRVRAMFDDKGNRVEEAGPSTPVEVLGFEGLPNAGDPFEVVDEEKYARAISDKRQELKKYEEGKNVKKVTLDNLYETISAGEVQELKVIIKGDVQGSVEALKGMLEKLSTKEIRLNVIRAAAGAISDDDVMMASASDAIIIGFNVRPIASAKMLADREKVDIRKYNIIYRAQEDIQKAMEGLLSPELKEQEIGKAEVRNIFRVPKVGIVAGCYMLEGSVRRHCQVRVIREAIEIFQGKISSLKRFKDDAKEVVAGYECGIGIENCNDLKEGDMLEIYETVEVARTLGKPEDNGSDKA